MTSNSSLLEAVIGFNRWPFWTSFWALLILLLLFTILLGSEISCLHHYIELFLNKNFTGSAYLSSDFLLGILTLSFSACSGTVFVIYKFIYALSQLKISHIIGDD